MIKGMHGLIYSSEAADLRAFFKDKLGFPCNDVGDGWLIFDMPEADLGVHPAATDGGHGAPNGTHDISFYCDDVETTRTELTANGVEFEGEIVDRGFGLVTHFKAPGDLKIMLYQPRYTKA